MGYPWLPILQLCCDRSGGGVGVEISGAAAPGSAEAMQFAHGEGLRLPDLHGPRKLNDERHHGSIWIHMVPIPSAVPVGAPINSLESN